MKRLLLLLKALVLCVFAVAQTNENPLEVAAKARGNALFDAYFERWAGESRPVSAAELAVQNDTMRAVYDVFSEFYDPIHKKSKYKYFFDYTKSKYLIIQDSLPVFIADSRMFEILNKDSVIIETLNDNFEWETLNTFLAYNDYDKNHVPGKHIRPEDSIKRRDRLYDTLVNFRPDIAVTGKIPLYLNTDHKKVVSDYLNAVGPARIALDKYGGIDHFKFTRFIDRRRKHLQRYVKVFTEGTGATYPYAQGTFKWEVYNYPFILSITFDKALTKAKIEFLMGNDEIGFALYEKADKKWKELFYFNPRKNL